MNKSSPLILENICKSYPQGDGKVLQVLRELSITLESASVTALLGISGTGKSTLLNIAGLLEGCDSGHITICGQTIRQSAQTQNTVIRRNNIGFIFQFHNLLPEFSVLENVLLPQQIAGVNIVTAKKRAVDLLDRLLLSEQINKMPHQLSGGQQQRVAIARALANRPKLLLADEPTGNLDPSNALLVFQLLLSAAHEEGTAALIATHNEHLSGSADRIVRLENGIVVDIKR